MLRQPLEGRVIPPLLILAFLASRPPSTVCTFERAKGLSQRVNYREIPSSRLQKFKQRMK
jgi:hypothetical protein